MRASCPARRRRSLVPRGQGLPWRASAGVALGFLLWHRRDRPPPSSSRSRAGRSGSPTPTGCTSRPAARPSWTSSSTTCPSATASSTRCSSARACCTGSPPASAGEKVHQKRLPAGAPPWMETVRLHFPRWNRTADELCVTEIAQVVWAVQMSTVEFHPWNSRRADTEKPDEWRIDLDPGDRVRLRDRPPGRPRRARGARRARRGRLPEDLGRQRACTSTCGSRPTTASRTYAGPRSRSRGRSSGAPDDVTTDLVAQGPRPHQAVRGLQPERPRPHDRRRLLRAGQPRGDGLHPDPMGRGRRRRARRLHDRDGARRGTPSSATCTRDIDDHVFDLGALLEWASATRRRGPRCPMSRRSDFHGGWPITTVC